MTASSRRALLAVILLAGPRLAHAEAPSSPPTPEQVEAARVLYREARELKRQGKAKEALEKALEAYRTAPTPVTALEAGALLVDAGRLVEARDLVRGVAQLPVSPRESEKGRAARQEAASTAASIDARIPKIAVAGRPAGIEVLLDGKALPPGTGTAWQGVDPGTHAIVARDGERACSSINITLAEGEERTIDLHDAASTCHPAPAPIAAPAPSTPAPPPAPAAAPAPTPPAPEERSAGRWIGAAIGGAGLVAVGVGGALALGAKSDYDAAAGACPARGCSQAGFDARTSARSRADAAGVVMLAGAAAVAAGVVLFFWPRGDGGRAQVAVGPGDVRLRVTW